MCAQSSRVCEFRSFKMHSWHHQLFLASETFEKVEILAEHLRSLTLLTIGILFFTRCYHETSLINEITAFGTTILLRSLAKKEMMRLVYSAMRENHFAF